MSKAPLCKGEQVKTTECCFYEAKSHERELAKGFIPANQRHGSGQVADAVGGEGLFFSEILLLQPLRLATRAT